MRIVITVDVTREDDVELKGEKIAEILERLEEEVGGIQLDGITKYEGTEREEEVGLSVEVVSVERESGKKKTA